MRYLGPVLIAPCALAYPGIATRMFARALALSIMLGVVCVSCSQSASAQEMNTDSDTTPDVWDNCVTVPNESQADADDDGVGNACDADFDNNGIVNTADLAAFRAAFGSNSAPHNLDGVGIVSFADLAIFRTYYGQPAPPHAVRFVAIGEPRFDGVYCLGESCTAVDVGALSPSAGNTTAGEACRVLPPSLDAGGGYVWGFVEPLDGRKVYHTRCRAR